MPMLSGNVNNAGGAAVEATATTHNAQQSTRDLQRMIAIEQAITPLSSEMVDIKWELGEVKNNSQNHQGPDAKKWVG